MKRTTKIISIILALFTAFTMPFSAYAFTSKSIFTTSTYTHQSRFSGCTITEGIDVSNHNGTVDWAAVKKAGVTFAIVRIGCRGYASAGTLMEDKVYKENIEGAYNAGLKVGVYFYSQALNKTEAKEEAKFVINRIGAYKSKIKMPVYYDYEFAGTSSGRLDSAWKNGTITKTSMTANAKAFCNTIQNAGYDAGIYASKSFFEDNLNYKDLEDKYDIWLAHYTTSTGYKGEFSLWQFSSKGTVSGIKGYVDSNFMYTKVTFDDTVIERQAFTGEEIKPEFSVSYDGTPLTKGEDYYVTFFDNINYGTGRVTVTGVNDYALLKPRTYTYEIVPGASYGVTLTKRTGTAISLKWDANPEAQGYQIIYYDALGRHIAGEAELTEFTATGLTGATTYQFTVNAYRIVDGKKYYGVESKPLTAITKPTKVKGIKTVSRTKNGFTLKWTKQAGAKDYTVYMYNAETGKYEIKGTTVTNSLVLKKLKPNTAYKFKIKASVVTEKGLTAYGALSNVYTAYTAPKTPKIKSVKSTGVKVLYARWKGVSGATGYQVMWSTTSTFTTNKKSKRINGTNRLAFKVAQSGGSYYVRVRAYVIRNGKYYYSAWSDAIHTYSK